jgi:hypothetical protein
MPEPHLHWASLFFSSSSGFPNAYVNNVRDYGVYEQYWPLVIVTYMEHQTN